MPDKYINKLVSSTLILGRQWYRKLKPKHSKTHLIQTERD